MKHPTSIMTINPDPLDNRTLSDELYAFGAAKAAVV